LREYSQQIGSSDSDQTKEQAALVAFHTVLRQGQLPKCPPMATLLKRARQCMEGKCSTEELLCALEKSEVGKRAKLRTSWPELWAAAPNGGFAWVDAGGKNETTASASLARSLDWARSFGWNAEPLVSLQSVQVVQNAAHANDVQGDASDSSDSPTLRKRGKRSASSKGKTKDSHSILADAVLQRKQLVSKSDSVGSLYPDGFGWLDPTANRDSGKRSKDELSAPFAFLLWAL